MHEHIFIENIIRQVPDSDKVRKVDIEVGDLAGIEPAHLKEHLIEHTGWEVIARKIKSKVKCNCGYIGEARVLQRLHELVIYNCPKCAGSPEVIEGKDIKIEKVAYN